METTERACPTCGEVLAENEGRYVCAEHGAWVRYGANLLVRVPSAEDKAPERVPMPWEPVAFAV